MKDVDCPYCGHAFDINHDDGHGLSEGDEHQDQCPKCEKNFVFSTYISVSHTAHKADCLNGAPHRLKKTNTFPDQYARMRCEDCGHEQPIGKTP